MSVQVLVGTIKGAFVLRSDSARQRWQIEGPLFKGWKTTASARTPDGEFLVATASDVYGAAVHRGRDLGDLKQVPASPRYADDSGFKLNQIWKLVADGEPFYAGVDEAGLFASTDGGDTWSQVEGLTGHATRDAWYPGFGGLCAHSILTDKENPDRVWVGISAVGVFRTDDAGSTWHPKNEGVPVIIEDRVHKDIGYCVHALTQDPEDAATIYRQDHKGMFRTRDGGETWHRIQDGLPSDFGFPLVMDRNTKALYAFPLESDEYRMPPDGKLRVYRSQDGGDSWEVLASGLPEENTYVNVLRQAMAVDDMEPCGVYFGTTAGSVHVSNDGGDSWQTLPCTLPRILSVEAYEV